VRFHLCVAVGVEQTGVVRRKDVRDAVAVPKNFGAVRRESSRGRSRKAQGRREEGESGEGSLERFHGEVASIALKSFSIDQTVDILQPPRQGALYKVTVNRENAIRMAATLPAEAKVITCPTPVAQPHSRSALLLPVNGALIDPANVFSDAVFGTKFVYRSPAIRQVLVIIEDRVTSDRERGIEISKHVHGGLV